MTRKKIFTKRELKEAVLKMDLDTYQEHKKDIDKDDEVEIIDDEDDTNKQNNNLTTKSSMVMEDDKK